MQTEFHGEPVAGGTFPALIWKTFMEPACRNLTRSPRAFPSPPYLSPQAKRIVCARRRRRARQRLLPRRARGRLLRRPRPATTAKCNPNEVDVPHVVGHTVDTTRGAARGAAADREVIYTPAKAAAAARRRRRPVPERRARSPSYDDVTLVLAEGAARRVPNLVGLDAAEGARELQPMKLTHHVTSAKGRRARARAAPAPGVAAAPGSGSVGRGRAASVTRAGDPEAPRAGRPPW